MFSCVFYPTKEMNGSCPNHIHEDDDDEEEKKEEGGNSQNDNSRQAARVQNTEDTVTLQRRTLTVTLSVGMVIILALLGGVIITAYRLREVTDQLDTGVSDGSNELSRLSTKEGLVPGEVWRWIVAAKADMTLNPQSAHNLLKVSADGKSLYQESSSSPTRALTAETYQVCICVSSDNLLDTRSYFELKVAQKVPWTIGLRTESFNADNTPDTNPDAGIWTIASAQDKIIINDGKATPLMVIRLAKLGLYLDYARGQVSFYDAVAKRHLHSYLTTFKEKLRFYAAFQIGIEETQEVLLSFL
ncbi:nuclear factor 7, ovary-like [Clarias gariepinus]|uniref:nuclear factor 7, ovary-like n=1 Tax=Clarias gariepinus TaxID=13013 RepID=UPI00234DEE35|nr:nuclear factor 7, ovary-like [Clarias gariepinus]